MPDNEDVVVSEPEASAEPAPAAEPVLAPFSIAKGRRFRFGYRTGRVDSLRGGGKTPYDARITWEGEKYPQYWLYLSLKREYESGNLTFL